MTPIKKCNRPGGICNRSCMGGGVVGSPESECPFPERPEEEHEDWPVWPLWLLYVVIFATCYGIGGLILAGLIYFFG